MHYLGTIQGGSGASNNMTTGASGSGVFTIPATVRALYLVPSVSGMLMELGAQTGISFLTSAARGAQIQGPNVINGPFRVNSQNPVVSVYWSGAGVVTCRVYAAPVS